MRIGKEIQRDSEREKKRRKRKIEEAKLLKGKLII
jgi:hypothetical protein